MSKIAESAKSSPNRRAFEAIINCSTQFYSTRSIMKGDDVHWEKAEGGCKNRTTSSLMYASEASKASKASSSGTKHGCIICEGGTEGVMTSRVRSLSS